MIRIAIGLVLGLLAAMMLIGGVQVLLHALFPQPLPDMADMAAVEAFMASTPLPAKWGLIGGYAAGAFAGAMIAAGIGRRRWVGWAIGAVLAVFGVMNFMALPHPLWIVAASMAAYAAGAWLGARIGAKA